jgi:hypothetical protein
MDDFDKMMNKHFDAAGIEEDAPGQGEQQQQPAPAQEQQQEKPDAIAETIDKSIGAESKATEQPGTEKVVGSEQSAAAKSDKPNGGTDGKTEQGKKPEGQAAGNPNDLTLQDGTIVKAGGERRWYETARIARQNEGNIRRDMNNLQTKYDDLVKKNTAFEQAAAQVGVADPTEMQAALRLYKDLRTDPQGTMKQLLVDMKQLGHNVEGIGPSVDTQALLALLDQRLPQTAVEAKQQNIQDEVQTEVANFFKDNPDARLHENVIALVLANHPEASLTDAYLAVKTQALEQGFDWTKDLAPQVEARKAAGGQQQQPNMQPQQQQQKPIIDGRALNGNATQHDSTKHITQAEDFGDAIRAGMRDAGMNV